MSEYDDYKPSTTIRWTKDGKEVTRSLFLRAETEAELLDLADCPQRGDQLDLAPASGLYDIVYCEDIQATQVDNAAGDADGFLWEVSATYRPLTFNNPTVNKARWRLSFRPQQINLKNVERETDQVHYGQGGSGSEPPDYASVKTAINLTEEGPQGVDIDEMVEVLTIDFWKSPTAVEDFITDVRGIVNKVNLAAFEGPWGSYAAGEARITGLEVNYTSGELSTVTVEISRMENASAVSVYLDSTGTEVPIDKGGWEYLWVRFVKGNLAGDDDVRALAIDAHVATVYKAGDFDLLDISESLWS